MLREGGSTVVVTGGDLSSVLLALRLLERGIETTLVSDPSVVGTFGKSPGRFCVHEGYDPHGLEQEHGHGVAADVLAYRQFVLDELESDLARWQLHSLLADASGVQVAHEPRGMLALREQHEAQNRHGALRQWGSSAMLVHGDASARLVSRLAGNRVGVASEFMEALMQECVRRGGRVLSVLGGEGAVDPDTTVVSFEAPRSAGEVWETFVQVAPDVLSSASSPAWIRNHYPLFDWAQSMSDGTWRLGSRRSWSTHSRESVFPRDHAWMPRGGRIVSKQQRSFWWTPNVSLPTLSQAGTRWQVLGVGQEDAVMDLIAADLAQRALLHQPNVFERALGITSHQKGSSWLGRQLKVRSHLDDLFAKDVQVRR